MFVVTPTGYFFEVKGEFDESNMALFDKKEEAEDFLIEEYGMYADELPIPYLILVNTMTLIDDRGFGHKIIIEDDETLNDWLENYEE